MLVRRRARRTSTSLAHHRPWALVGAAIALLGILTLAATVLAASGPSGQPSPQKQALLNRMQSARATAAAGPHAPKHPELRPPASCPIDPRTVKTGIFPFRNGPFSGGLYMTTQVGAVSSQGVPYVIYAGAEDGDPQQGLLIVLRLETDPCAVEASGHGQGYQRSFPSPYQQGALTATRIAGDTIIFTTASGHVGSFNYVTSQYLS